MTLDQYLEKTGEGVREFARRSGLDVATVSRIRRGMQNATAITAHKIIAASSGKVTLKELANGGA